MYAIRRWNGAGARRRAWLQQGFLLWARALHRARLLRARWELLARIVRHNTARWPIWACRLLEIKHNTARWALWARRLLELESAIRRIAWIVVHMGRARIAWHV